MARGHHDDTVDSDQEVVNKELVLSLLQTRTLDYASLKKRFRVGVASGLGWPGLQGYLAHKEQSPPRTLQ